MARHARQEDRGDFAVIGYASVVPSQNRNATPKAQGMNFFNMGRSLAARGVALCEKTNEDR
ncbi:MAG TPA: hypothetical protein VHW00_07665 [Thermoanaerobaculia bacterium]|nr:hypothetical protein [Thermoanaerobaculia bacterium]